MVMNHARALVPVSESRYLSARRHASCTTSSASRASRVSHRARLYPASRCGMTSWSKRCESANGGSMILMAKTRPAAQIFPLRSTSCGLGLESVLRRGLQAAQVPALPIFGAPRGVDVFQAEVGPRDGCPDQVEVRGLRALVGVARRAGRIALARAR